MLGQLASPTGEQQYREVWKAAIDQ
uniref:Uncharacterized protein n=1 Tax=Megaselia scalaris TaxID=36166 RepID=T1H4D5_MEGSC